MEKKKIVIAISIIMFTIICFVLFIAYASFSSDISNRNNSIINVNVSGDAFNFTVSGTTEISLNVGLEKMGRGNGNLDVEDELRYKIGNPQYVESNTIDINLKTINTNDLYGCTYDLVWTWTGNDQYTTSDVVSNIVAYNETDFLILPVEEYATFEYWNNGYDEAEYIQGQFEIGGIAITTGNPEDYPAENEYIVSKDFSKFTWEGTAGQPGYKTTILKNAKIYSNSENGTNTRWILFNSIYNIPIDQSEFLGKEYKGRVTVENVRCGIVPPTNENYIVSGDINTVGSEISLKGENFYVIPNDIIDDDSTVALLAKYPLYVGEGWDGFTWEGITSDDCTQKGFLYADGECYQSFSINESADGVKQSPKAISYTQGYGDNLGIYNGIKLSDGLLFHYNGQILSQSFDFTDLITGVYYHAMSGVNFSETEYYNADEPDEGRTCKYVYDSNSNYYYYNELYKDYLENNLGVNINSVRPISLEQVLSMGNNFIYVDSDINMIGMLDLPEWLVNPSYFTGSSCGGRYIIIMGLFDIDESYGSRYPIRPMVVINKNELQNLLS